MLAIKLQRIGKKHQPSYRVVVAERRSKMAARPIEDLGSYNPFSKAWAVKKERVDYWLKAGAQPTVTVHNLLVQNKVLNKSKVLITFKKKVVSGAEASAPVAATPAA